jgi:small subunit ribosomal protein S4
MKRKHKIYSRPRRPFDKQRIIDEAKIKKEFGLKNKKEIWKAQAKINSFRERAKSLVSASEEEQNILFNKLNKIGIKVSSIAEVLSLEPEDWLKRRLQFVVFKKGLANTIKHARQLITHKKVLVDNRVVNIPSFIVEFELENKISVIKKIKKKKEEIKEEENLDIKEKIREEQNGQSGKED